MQPVKPQAAPAVLAVVAMMRTWLLTPGGLSAAGSKLKQMGCTFQILTHKASNTSPTLAS